jgi:hypothetical protein
MTYSHIIKPSELERKDAPMKSVLRIGILGAVLAVLFAGTALAGNTAQKDYVPSGCKIEKTTICTIEIWLERKYKKHNREIREMLKDESIKVIRNTIQYWPPKGGHPPTNIAIGRSLTAEDARWVISLALDLNDNIDGLVFQRLNPPYYVAIGTSAWDDKSETPITPEQLTQLRDPKLTTEEFHALYVKLTGEAGVAETFY